MMSVVLRLPYTIRPSATGKLKGYSFNETVFLGSLLDLLG